jgi:hypothetical protein
VGKVNSYSLKVCDSYTNIILDITQYILDAMETNLHTFFTQYILDAMDTNLHIFLISALDGGERSAVAAFTA